MTKIAPHRHAGVLGALIAILACTTACDSVPLGAPRVVAIPGELDMPVGMKHDVAVFACQPSYDVTKVLTTELTIAFLAAMGRIDALLAAPEALLPGCERMPIEAVRTEWLSGAAFESTPRPDLARPDALAYSIAAGQAGTGRLRIVARGVDGEELETEVVLRAWTVDRVEATACGPLYPVDTAVPVNVALWSGDVRLSGYGTSPLVGAGLTLVGASGSTITFRTPASPGTARITSPLDPSVAVDLEIVDGGRVTGFELVRDATPVVFPTRIESVTARALVDGRTVCQDTFPRELTNATPDVCSAFVSQSAITHLPEVIDVLGERRGTCSLGVAVAGHAPVATLEVAILPSFVEMEGSRIPGVVPNALWASDGQIFAVGRDIELGTRAIVHYDGASWTRAALDPLPSSYLAGVWGAARGDVIAVGGDMSGAGHVLQLDGGTWKPVHVAAAPLAAVWGSGAADVFAVGAQNQVLRRTAGAWSAVDLSALDLGGDSVNWLDIGGTGPEDVYVAGCTGQSSGRIAHYDGLGWQLVADNPLAGSGCCQEVWAAPDDNVLVLCGNKTIQLTPDGSAYAVYVEGRDAWGPSRTALYHSDASARLFYWDGWNDHEVYPRLGYVQALFGVSATEAYAIGGGGSDPAVYRLQ